MQTQATATDEATGLRDKLRDYERQLIVAALSAAGGNQRRAARSLGVLPSTLCEKMKRLGIRSRTVYSVENVDRVAG